MFQVILDWSEVWALIFPLVIHQIFRHQPYLLNPVLVYLWGALLLNLIGDVIGDFKTYLPAWMQTNLILYNLHSLFRFVCFVYFFSLIKQANFARVRQLLPYVYVLFAFINYIFLENYLDQHHISGNLFAIEAYVLLIYCILYYLSQLRDEVEYMQGNKEFWVVTGLSIYVVINFFIFLFYVPMIEENSILAEEMWGVHNLAYIILCFFITKAIYVPFQPDH
jgi:hypothetical protein